MPSSGPDRFASLDLCRWFDNVGCTGADDLGAGAFNSWGNSLPARAMPAAGRPFPVAGVPFVLGRGPGGDNLRCRGQRLPVQPGLYDWIWVLGAAERRSEDPVYLHYEGGGLDPEWLRLSDFWPDTPARFGEVEAVRAGELHYPRHVQPNMRPGLWVQRLPVPRLQKLEALTLPENPAMHLFA